MAFFEPQWLRAVVIFAVCKDVFVFSVSVGDGSGMGRGLVGDW